MSVVMGRRENEMIACLYEVGVLVHDIEHVTGATRAQIADAITMFNASRDNPVMPETPWTRLGRLLLAAQADRDKLSGRVRKLTEHTDV